MAKFNYRGADEEDVNGLVDRDEVMEYELRNVVMGYLQKLICQMALAKKVIQDFKNVYAPVQQTTMQTSPAKQEANNEELGMRVNTEDEAGVAGADDEE